MSDDAPDPRAPDAADAEDTLDDGYEDGDEYEEYEDDEDDEAAEASAPEAPSHRVSVAQLLGISAVCLAMGAMLAGGVLGVVAAADAPTTAVAAALAAAPASRTPPPRPRATTPDAAVALVTPDAAVADVAAPDAAVAAQEADPEDVGDGVMDDLDDGPAPAPRRPRSRPSLQRAAITPSAGGGGAGHVTTSDSVPEGSVQGYVRGRPVRIEVTRIDGKPVERHTAAAYRQMHAAASRDGVLLRIVSGFRTMEHQQALYRAYLRGRGNLAALPGHSNHQSGHALDLNTRAPGVLRWLERNGRRFGFRRTVPTEAWHWEWW